MRIARLIIPVPLALGACVAPPAAPPVPRPAPPRPVSQPALTLPAANWADRPVAPGSWAYMITARGSVATYGMTAAIPAFTLACDRTTRVVTASRTGSAAGRMTLRATTGARAYATVLSQGGRVTATLAASDPQLDALAFSRGRILIGLDGAPDLVLPIWPEFARVVEDCR